MYVFFFLQFPFDTARTVHRPFFNENDELVGVVPMMSQTNVIRNVYIKSLKSTIVELPYGGNTEESLINNRFSMLLIYPHTRHISAVFRALRKFNIANIFAAFPTDENDFDEIIITLPKFQISSNLDVKSQLEQLGVTDVFNPNRADLSKMFGNQSRDPPYLSRVLHKAKIQVNEFGTVASAVTVASISFRSFADEIIFDRPFGFLIVDQLTNSILFAGQVNNPQYI